MTDPLVHAVVSFVAVFGGLYVLWALIARRMPADVRLTAAAVAGLVSAAVTLAFAFVAG